MTHRAPIVENTLSAKLRCLSEKEVARTIIKGIYDIPTDLNNVTKLILEEIGKMRMKIGNKKGQEIVITPENFI